MEFGFVNKDWENKIHEIFDLYIEMIKNSEPGSVAFNFASTMLRNHVDCMYYSRENYQIKQEDER